MLTFYLDFLFNNRVLWTM